MKRKNFISLTVAVVFTVLACTGLLLYVKQKAHFIEMTHTIFGLLFVSFAVFHIVNNWGSLKAYSKDREKGGLRKELLVAAGIGAVMLTLAVTEVLEPIAEFGRIFAAPKKGGPPSVSFEERHTQDSTSGRQVVLLLQKKKDDVRSVLSIAVADSSGKPLETLLGSEGAKEGPPTNLLLHTRIATAPPFTLVVTSNFEGKVKTSRTQVRSLDPGVTSLDATGGSPLERAFLEVR